MPTTASYTAKKIQDAKDLVKRFAPDLNDNELFVLDIALKDICKATLSDCLKMSINGFNEIETEINK